MAQQHQNPALDLDSASQHPFYEHLAELRRRFVYIALAAGVGTAAAYGVQKYIVLALLRPTDGQKFIYTSPGGGIDFLFRVCLYAGIAVSIPVIIYNFLRYVEPAFPRRSVKFIYWGTAISALLALAGVCFGYFIGLPSAMNFLLHQSVTSQIQPLLTVQAYMSFVVRYMVGSALLFQMPLILIFINRIKPLKPRRLFHYERWVIVGAFIVSALMNPTPRISSLLIVAGPLMIMYQLSIGVIAFTNRKLKKFEQLTIEMVPTALPIVEPEPQPALQPVITPAANIISPRPRQSPMPGLQPVGGRMVISDFFVAPRPQSQS